MAKRSRHNRKDIPGYDENRPSREERKQQHRANRHATHQMLHSLDDPDEVVLPEENRIRKPDAADNGKAGIPDYPNEPPKRRYRVWKTKFWKRRDSYKEQKAQLDSQWPVIPPDQLPDE